MGKSEGNQVPQLNIMDILWNNKMYMATVPTVLAAAITTLCMFKSLAQLEKPTSVLVRSEYFSLSLNDLTQGRVNISTLSVNRRYILDDASKSWRPNQVYVPAVMFLIDGSYYCSGHSHTAVWR